MIMDVIQSITAQSEFLETDGISRLDFFPVFDLFGEIVDADLSIFNDTSDLEFVHAESDGHDFRFVVPDETINDDLFLDFLKKS